MQEEGYLAAILVDEGAENIPVGQLVAIMVEEEEDVAAFKDYKPEEGASTPAPAATPAASEPAQA